MCDTSTGVNPVDHIALARSIASTFRSPRDRDYEDVCQEAAIGLVQAAKAFDPAVGKEFAALAGTSITRAVICYFRSRRSRRMPTLSELIRPGEEERDYPVEAPAEQDLVEQADEAARLRRAIKKLCGKDQKMIELVFGLGGKPPLTISAVARVLRVPRGKVYVRMKAAFAILRSALERKPPAATAFGSQG